MEGALYVYCSRPDYSKQSFVAAYEHFLVFHRFVYDGLTRQHHCVASTYVRTTLKFRRRGPCLSPITIHLPSSHTTHSSPRSHPKNTDYSPPSTPKLTARHCAAWSHYSAHRVARIVISATHPTPTCTLSSIMQLRRGLIRRKSHPIEAPERSLQVTPPTARKGRPLASNTISANGCAILAERAP